MVQPHVPSVVLGNIKNGYAKGDLMDANAVIELIDKSHEEGEYMTRSDVQQMIEELINGAPEQLDTLGELATAIGEDADFKETIQEQITTIERKSNMDVDGDRLVIG